MPHVRVGDVDLYYELIDCTEPWRPGAPPVVLLHGLGTRPPHLALSGAGVLRPRADPAGRPARPRPLERAAGRVDGRRHGAATSCACCATSASRRRTWSACRWAAWSRSSSRSTIRTRPPRWCSPTRSAAFRPARSSRCARRCAFIETQLDGGDRRRRASPPRSPTPSIRSMRDYLIEQVALNDKERYVRAARAAFGFSTCARGSAEIAAPTLVVVGEDDRTFPLAWMEDLGGAHPRRPSGAHRRRRAHQQPGAPAGVQPRRARVPRRVSAMDDLTALLSGPARELGFGGVAGAVVGYTAKKVTKLVALALGLMFIAIQGAGLPALRHGRLARRADTARARVDRPAGRHPRRPCLGDPERQPAVRRRLRGGLRARVQAGVRDEDVTADAATRRRSIRAVASRAPR